MSSFSIDDLKREALGLFGRELSDEQLEIYQGRLPTMLQNVRLLQDWGKRLEKAHPAQIQCPAASPDSDATPNSDATPDGDRTQDGGRDRDDG